MSGGGGSTTTTTRELSPEQSKLIGLAMPAAEAYAKSPPTLPEGSGIVGFNPLQQQGMDQLLGANPAVGAMAGSGINTALGVQSMAPGTMGSAASLMGSTAMSRPMAQSVFQGGQQGVQGLGDVLGGFNDAKPARDFLMSGALLDPNTNPVLGAQTESAIRPIFDNLQRSVLPGVRSSFIDGNMFGSSRQGIAEGNAIGDAVRTAGDVATGIQNNNFNQGLNAMASTVGQTGSLATQAGSTLGGLGVQGRGQDVGAATATTGATMENILRSLFAGNDLASLAYTPGQVTSGVGGQQAALEQAQLTEARDRFMSEQMMPFLAAQDVAQLAMGLPGGATTSAATGGGSRFGGLGGLLGMGIGAMIPGAGPMGMMLGGTAGRTLGDLF